MSDSSPPPPKGLLASLTSAQKAWALLTGLVVTGALIGVGWADIRSSYATAEALTAYAESTKEDLDALEEKVDTETELLERRTTGERDKVWQKVNEVSSLAGINGARLEMLLLYQERQLARPIERRAIDERLGELRSGGAPQRDVVDPLAAIREDL